MEREAAASSSSGALKSRRHSDRASRCDDVDNNGRKRERRSRGQGAETEAEAKLMTGDEDDERERSRYGRRDGGGSRDAEGRRGSVGDSGVSERIEVEDRSDHHNTRDFDASTESLSNFSNSASSSSSLRAS